LYGSSSEKDPGWNLSDTNLYTPLATLDSRGLPSSEYQALSLVAPPGGELGMFRWIVWAVTPVTPSGEHTAFRELSVETSH
jgi:hypothetical protein